MAGYLRLPYFTFDYFWEEIKMRKKTIRIVVYRLYVVAFFCDSGQTVAEN